MQYSVSVFLSHPFCLFLLNSFITIELTKGIYYIMSNKLFFCYINIGINAINELFKFFGELLYKKLSY